MTPVQPSASTSEDTTLTGQDVLPLAVVDGESDSEVGGVALDDDFENNESFAEEMARRSQRTGASSRGGIVTRSRTRDSGTIPHTALFRTAPASLRRS